VSRSDSSANPFRLQHVIAAIAARSSLVVHRQRRGCPNNERATGAPAPGRKRSAVFVLFRPCNAPSAFVQPPGVHYGSHSPCSVRPARSTGAIALAHRRICNVEASLCARTTRGPARSRSPSSAQLAVGPSRNSASRFHLALAASRRSSTPPGVLIEAHSIITAHDAISLFQWHSFWDRVTCCDPIASRQTAGSAMAAAATPSRAGPA